jgi:hypothetical protein
LLPLGCGQGWHLLEGHCPVVAGRCVLPFPGRQAALALGQCRLTVTVEHVYGRFMRLGRLVMNGGRKAVRCHAPAPVHFLLAARLNHPAALTWIMPGAVCDLEVRLTGSTVADQPYVGRQRTARNAGGCGFNHPAVYTARKGPSTAWRASKARYPPGVPSCTEDRFRNGRPAGLRGS